MSQAHNNFEITGIERVFADDQRCVEITIYWFCPSLGFGTIMLYGDENDRLQIDAEAMGAYTVLNILDNALKDIAPPDWTKEG